MRWRLRGVAHPVVLLLCLAGGGSAAGQQAPPTDLEYPFVPKEFPKSWIIFSSSELPSAGPTWQVNREQAPADGVLICLGKPDGYIRTEKAYENYEFCLEWMFPNDPNGNSGVLLHIVEKDMIWPKCIQLQMHRPTAGSVFPHSGAKSDNMLAAIKDSVKPVGEWNKSVITCDAGKITVVLNGRKIGEVTGCMPQKGSIGLQSEGAEVHFRSLWLRPLIKIPNTSSK